MALHIKNVAIVGATGTAGSKIFQALVDSGHFSVTAIARKPISVKGPGTTVKVVDMESMDDLVEAFKGQDAVIDVTMAPDSALPLRLINAAVTAGVMRFIPSEFSLSPENTLGRSVPVYDVKNQVYNRLKELASAGKLTYTTISNGAFLDWILRTGIFKLDLKNKKAELMNGGTVIVPWTLLDHIGTATVNVLLHPEATKNRPIHISTIQKSQKEMLALAQEALGKEGWTVSTVDMEPVYQESLAQLQAGNITFEVMVNMILYCNSREDYAGKWEKEDNLLLNVQKWSDDQVKQLISSIAAE